jgi:hypothetical protein
MTKSRSNAVAPAAKGQLVVGSGTDASTTLAVASTAGYVLTVDSAEATGLKWAAAAAGGKVLQVVNVTYGTETATNSNTYSDIGLSASITPSSTSNKVLVIVDVAGIIKLGNNSGQKLRLVRGSTTILEFSAGNGITDNATPTNINVAGAGCNYLDSPATTSSTTYKVQQGVSDGLNGTVRCQHAVGSLVSNSSITLLEIGA